MCVCTYVCMYVCTVRVVVRVLAYVYLHVCEREDVCVRLRMCACACACACDGLFLPGSQSAEFVASAHFHKVVTCSSHQAVHPKFALEFEHNTVVGWGLETICKVW